MDAAAVRTPTRTFVDADGHVIRRYGNPDKLGSLADKARVGAGPDDARVVRDDFVVMSSKDAPSDRLTVPRADISGIEDPRLTAPNAHNYFADAWKDGRAPGADRNEIALAVNSQGGRSQDRLHIHADRVDPQLGRELKDQLDDGVIAKDHWSEVKPAHGHPYRALWIEGTDLNSNPFQLVHDGLAAENGAAYADSHMSQHTIAVVPQTDALGHQGFIILDGNHNSSAEEWLFGHADTPR